MKSKQPKQRGRQAKGNAISLMPDVWAWIEERLETLGPLVASRSHYFARLIELDRRLNLLGGQAPPTSADLQPGPVAMTPEAADALQAKVAAGLKNDSPRSKRVIGRTQSE